MSDRSYFSRVIIESASDHKQSRPSKAGGFFHASSKPRLRRSFSLLASAFPLHTCQLESAALPLLLAVGVRLPSTHASSNPRLCRSFSLMASAFPLHTCQLEVAPPSLLLADGVRLPSTHASSKSRLRRSFSLMASAIYKQEETAREICERISLAVSSCLCMCGFVTI